MKRQAPDFTALFRDHLTASQKRNDYARKGLDRLQAGDEVGAHRALKRAEGYELKARRIEARVRAPKRRVTTSPQ